MTDQPTHGDFEALLQATLDACDSLLNAKDAAAKFANRLGVEAELSEIVSRIHALQNAVVPGFQD
jgi:hypothetical protein